MAETEITDMNGMKSDGAELTVKKNSKKPTARKRKKGADEPVSCQYCGMFRI